MPDSLSASEYILDNFKPSDRVAMLLRNRTTEEVIQRIASAEKIAAPIFNNGSGEESSGIRHLHRHEHSERGRMQPNKTRHPPDQARLSRLGLPRSEALKAIQNSDDVPKPNFVLDTSPGKHQSFGKSKELRPKRPKTYNSEWPMSSERISPQPTLPVSSAFLDSQTESTTRNALSG